jgi:hypothetical protein
MVFPVTPLPLRCELNLDGWVAATVREESSVTLSRGSEDGVLAVKPSQCSLTLDDTAGDLSPRNPLGAYYGVIGRNTPIRVGIERDTSYLLLDGYASTITTPDHASLELPSFYFELDFESDDVAGPVILAHKWDSDTNNRTWKLVMTSGSLVLFISTNGANEYYFQSTERLRAMPGGRAIILCQYESTTGTTHFYSKQTESGSWVQLGSGLTYGTTMTPYNGVAPMVIGQKTPEGEESTGSFVQVALKINSACLYDTTPTIQAWPVMAAVPAGVTSFVDPTGKTWTLTGNAEITDVDWEFVGEVPSWPRSVDFSGKDATVSVNAAGILRRIQSAKDHVASALRRAATVNADDASVLAYWPCEDGSLSERLTAVKGIPATYSGAPGFEQCTSFACSDPLPTWTSSTFSGIVPFYTASGLITVRALLDIPSGGVTSGSSLLTLHLTGGISAIRAWYSSGGNLALTAYDLDGSILASSTITAFDVDDSRFQIGLSIDSITTPGTAICTLSVYKVGDSGGTYTTHNFTGYVYRVTSVEINRGKYISQAMGGGHVIVRKDNPTIFDLITAVNAHNDEQTSYRFQRLCYENNVPYRNVSQGYTDSVRSGEQKTDSLISLLEDAANSDGAILSDDDFPRLGLKFRQRSTLWSQVPAVTIDYATDALSDITPVDDDMLTANDVTVTRRDSASYRSVKETGTMSVKDFPEGIGRYDPGSIELSLSDDGMAQWHSEWMLHIGTLDEPRYPTIGIIGEMLSTAQLTAMTKLRVGDLIVIKNIPDVYGDVKLLVNGINQKLNQFGRRWVLNTSPGSPYNVARYGITRYDTVSSTLGSSVTASATSLSVIESGTLWTTTPARFPLDIRVGPEVMTVTAIAGATSPQTFTVTRGTNGLAVAHDVGATVQLAETSFYGF